MTGIDPCILLSINPNTPYISVMRIITALAVLAPIGSPALASEKPNGSYRPLGEPQAGEVIEGLILKR